ncbi:MULTISPECIES: NAD(P)/FAD-dependent oxidoreductase [Psychrilyobacter]|uniref:Aminoacetone oxidase family FAD-binding enzyme n=1 Tax=Psychrilyobacter piezotolerans TaxID=2293438 RepID=A0ABX9KCZ0_9FUSO|nr:MULTISPECIES: NAD(P)/FAD-dependent oxidoreductase [Psychrilyobacter]MCS5422747.1 NAD(P)/FAD-dependent oxidoreductase [Psychrilyobacter sp. S5]NDI79228.1 NAD(P)/FAD-dependent oxidoreductase [Psychrilyobacter piezotolerans]RDE58842.1 NAD(P)/FAD-dependent oxidoreductase [Psychrilyobacter sp. S5]REI39340.1 aminoacetone oxidase family FAD-binding enzyme [Psychrilyobacter piezotolerans]
MKIYEYIVVGGGPAGIFSAIYAGSCGIKTAILEKKNRMGKKILIAGSGQCNITHTGEVKEFLTKYGDHGKFLRTAIYKYSPEDLQIFFKDHGLELVPREDGKIFPITKRSADVVELLYSLCKKYNVDIIENCEVLSIIHKDDFTLNTSTGDFNSKNILLSTGGITFPQTGSEGQGYRFAKTLGHKILEPKPCLTPIYIKDYPFTELAGISFKDISISVFDGDKKINSSKGDILFTHKNLSGPGILDNSRYMKRGNKISFNFIDLTLEQFKEDFIEYTHVHGRNLTKTFLNTYNLPERFIKNMLFEAEICEGLKISSLSKKMRDDLGKLLTEYTYEISKLGGIDVGMATNGGIDLKEINPKTMESKLVKGLYFAGEIMDIDGDTGGYNIQAAISTGILAARSIAKSK